MLRVWAGVYNRAGAGGVKEMLDARLLDPAGTGRKSEFPADVFRAEVESPPSNVRQVSSPPRPSQPDRQPPKR